MTRDSWIDRLYAAAKKTGLSKRLSLYDLREMALVAQTIAPDGRTCIEMDNAEYDRLRDALGPDWEWRDVSIRFGREVCPLCHGRGAEVDYVGDEMKPVQVDCGSCRGTGTRSG